MKIKKAKKTLKYPSHFLRTKIIKNNNKIHAFI